MAFSVIEPQYERQLMHFCSILNKLVRLGLVNDVLVAAATSVDDLIADVYAALRSGTTELMGVEATMLVRRFEQYVRFMETIGLLDTTIVAALLTARGTSAATDLRFIASNVITESGFDAASESYPDADGVYAAAVTR